MKDLVYPLIGLILGLLTGIINLKWSIIEPALINYLNRRGKIGIKLARMFLTVKRWYLLVTIFFSSLKITISSYVSLWLRNVLEKPAIRIFLWVLLYYSLFWLIPPLPPKLSLILVDFFYSNINFLKINDKSTFDIIKFFNTVLQVLLPLSLTFYTFTYREQKTVSESATSNNLNKIPIILFIETAIFTIIYGMHLGYIINNSVINSKVWTGYNYVVLNNNRDLLMTAYESGKIIVWSLLYLTSIYLGFITVINLLRNINIKWLLNTTIKQTQKNFKRLPLSLPFPIFNKLRSKIYDNLILYIECIYQMLMLAVEKNMDHIYYHYYPKWINTLLHFLDELVFLNNDKTVSYLEPIKKDPEKFTSMYRSILKNHINLITVLCKKHKIEEVHECIKTLFKLNPREKEINLVFLQTLYELCVFLSENKSIGLRPLLREFEILSKEFENTERKGIVLIYEELLIKAVKSNDVKLLSSICYSLLRVAEDLETTNKNVGYMFRSLEKKKNGIKQFSEIKSAAIYLLLQVTLKSIELSYYSCTGFLIKFLVTNFKSDIFNRIFITFARNDVDQNPFIKPIQRFSNYNGWFFNEKTLQYCLKKMTILLYGQQKYAIQSKLNFGFVPTNLLEIRVAKCSYLDYIFLKLKKADSKYGLLFLEDPDFMSELKEKIYLHLRMKE